MLKHCAYEFCAKEHNRRGKFCSHLCNVTSWRKRKPYAWNAIQRKSNRKARSQWTPKRRQKALDYYRKYDLEHKHELKVKRALQ